MPPIQPSALRDAGRAFRARRWVMLPALAAQSLALAIAASVFTLGDQLHLRALPFPNGDRLYFVGPPSSRPGDAPQRVTLGELDSLRGTPAIEGAGGYAEGGFVRYSVAETDGLRVVTVTPELFEVLGIVPRIGRTFVAADAGAEPTPVMIAYPLWQQHFGENSQVVGTIVTLGDRRVHLIGVMPARLSFPAAANVWMVMSTARPAVDIRGWVAVARAGPGAIADGRIAGADRPFSALSLREGLRPKTGAGIPLAVLLVTAGIMLGGTWLQLGILRTTEVLDRSRDLAVRLALGATPATLLSQVVLEALLFAIVTTILAALLMPATLAQMATLVLPADLSPVTVAVDARAYAVLIGAAFVGVALSSVGPARLVTRLPFREGLAGASSLNVTPAQDVRLRWLAIQLTVAAACLHVSVAVTQEAQRAYHADLGFDRGGLLALDLTPDSRAVVTNSPETIDRIRSLPGVSGAALGFRPLLLAVTPRSVMARPAPDGGGTTGNLLNANVVAVGPGYFSVLRTPILRGRDFDLRLDVGTAGIIGETLARQIAPGQDVLSSGVYLDGHHIPVVGVVRDVVPAGPRIDTYPYFFTNGRPSALMVRAVPGQEDRVAAELISLFGAAGAASELRVIKVADTFDRLLASDRARVRLLATLSVSSLGLAALAAYVAASSLLRRQVRVIAIRKSLGATTFQLVRDLFRGSTVAAVAGVGGGMLIGRLSLHWLAVEEISISASAIAYLATTATVLVAVLLAGWWPVVQLIRTNAAEILKSP
jgi:putative ABC transport system permease protein